ncbi:MAG TPA: proton-conducting transporter membrane subunit [Methanoregulaceae archaeon]|nr:proton-conducting transporter membrane subunit [Methanoregulaceae archaeon]
MILSDLTLYVPLYIAIGGCVIYFATRSLPRRLRYISGTLTAVWLIFAFTLLFSVITRHAIFTDISFIGITGGLLITGIGAVAAWASQGNLDPEGPVHLYYPLFLFALAGATAVGFATDLFTIFVMVELSAIPVYALVAYRYRQEKAALSSAIKYLIQGVAGTITALFGIAILFFFGHTLSITGLPAALAGVNPSLVLIAAIFIILGYGVKLAIIPLHTWLPEAYARAPSGITAIMVGATKIGVLIALFLSLSALPAGSDLPVNLGIVVTFIAIVTMTVGNLLALGQSELRYALAYSSIAQMGYIFLGFGIGMIYNLALGYTAGLYYAIAYSLTKSGAFLSADAFATSAGSYETSKMKGLGARYPLLGLSLVVFVFGLIGVPFTCGFLGKLLLEQAGMATSLLSGFILALILGANSAISLGYYVPILSTLIFKGKGTDPGDTGLQNSQKIPVTIMSAIVFLAIVTVYFGLFPESFDWISHASSQLFTWGSRL